MDMKFKNTVNGSQGDVFITLNGENKRVAGFKDITVNAEIQSEDGRILGSRTIQSKNNGVKLSGTGTVYYGTKIFTNIILKYIELGEMEEWTLQVVNRDEAAGIGKQRMLFTGCVLTGTYSLALINVENAALESELSFTCAGVRSLESFNDTALYG